MFSWNEINNLPDVYTIIHLTGKAHDTKNQSKPEQYFEINTGLTKIIYNWFLKSNAKKFIYFSSVKAAADTVEGEILTEETTPSPIGPYGESKLAAENYMLDNLPANKRVYILRPCMIHGPGNKGNLNLLYNVVSSGIPWPLGLFDNKRSFCSIDNLSFVLVKLIENDIRQGVYNIADDIPLSTNGLIRLIANSLNKNPRILYFNKSFVKMCAQIGDYLNMPFNAEKFTKLTESFVVSNSKIKTALDIDQLPITSSEGMLKTFASFNK